MNFDSFGDRAEALENAFFAQVDAKLQEQLRQSLEHDKTADELATLSGLTDRGVLNALTHAGVTGRSLTALRIFPLVAVAWADNIIQENEREKVMLAAGEQGLTPKTPAGFLLQQWLQHKPSDEMFDAWEAYAKALVGKLSREEADALRRSLSNELENVARAAGGVLGWSAVSAGESKIIKRVMAALS